MTMVNNNGIELIIYKKLKKKKNHPSFINNFCDFITLVVNETWTQVFFFFTYKETYRDVADIPNDSATVTDENNEL